MGGALSIGALFGTLELEDKFAVGIDAASNKLKSFGEIGKAVAVGVGLLATGVIAAAAAIYQLGQRGSEVGDIRASFAGLTASVGDTDAVLAALRGSVDGTISDFDLMKSTNLAFSQGLRLTQDEMVLTGEAARILADRVGGDTKEAYDALTGAMATGKLRQLEAIGITIDADRVVKDYARSIGKEREELTRSEESTAKKNALLRILRGELDATGRAELDFADQVQRAKVFVANFTDNLAAAVAASPVVNAALAEIGRALGEAFGDDQSAIIRTLIGYVNSFALLLVDVAGFAVETARAIANAFYGVRGAFFAVLGWLTDMAQAYLDLQIKVAEGLKWVFPDAAMDAGIAKLQEVKTYVDGVGSSFNDSATDAIDSAAGTNAALDSTKGFLDTLRTAMTAAAGAEVDLDAAAGKTNETLRAQGEEAATTSDKLQDLIDQLSGKDAIKKAEDMVAAVDAVGGAHKLTRAEMEMALGVLNEVIDKYRAMGVIVPQNVQRAHDALTDMVAQSAMGAEAITGDQDRIGEAYSETARLHMNATRESLDDAMAHRQDYTDASIELLRQENMEAIEAYYGMGSAAEAAGDQATGALDRVSQAAEDAANHVWRLSGTFTQMLEELSEAEFNALGGEAELRAIEDSYRMHPGRRSGGSGDTGIGSQDYGGHLRMLEEQRRYQQLKNYMERNKGRARDRDREPPRDRTIDADYSGGGGPGGAVAGGPSQPNPRRRETSDRRGVPYGPGGWNDDRGYNPGTGGPWNQWPASSGSSRVTIERGAIEMHFPIVNDAKAISQLTELLGDALAQRLRERGERL